VLEENYYYHSVWGTGPDDVDVAGADLGLDRFDGEAWARQPLGLGYTRRVWGLGTEERYVLTVGTSQDVGTVAYRYR
jgi:hypothetical protein